MKKECSTCINFDKSGCVCAEACVNFDQWYIDEGIVERERLEAIEIIKEIYNNALDGFDFIQLGEDLYKRIEKFVETNV